MILIVSRLTFKCVLAGLPCRRGLLGATLVQCSGAAILVNRKTRLPNASNTMHFRILLESRISTTTQSKLKFLFVCYRRTCDKIEVSNRDKARCSPFGPEKSLVRVQKGSEKLQFQTNPRLSFAFLFSLSDQARALRSSRGPV